MSNSTTSPGPARGQDVEYRYGEPPDWGEHLGGLKIRTTAGGFLLAGECPRCLHYITKSLRDTTVPRLAPEEATYVITCNCTFYHRGAPAGQTGCGATGAVKRVSG